MSFIGPVLPPAAKEPAPEEEGKGDNSPVGPALPPHLLRKTPTPPCPPDEEQCNDGSADTYGPPLPPGFEPKPVVLGPTLPPSFKPAESDSDGGQSEEEQDRDDIVIGPLPPSAADLSSHAAHLKEIERRSQAMKDKILNKNLPQKPVRETWMLELPAERARQFGLGPRTFSRRSEAPSAGGSLWTETPSERERREREGPSKLPSDVDLVAKGNEERDAILEQAMAGHIDGKRKESLLDQHQKDRKRKMEEDMSKPTERRPFDRDIDLQVNRFDEAQREAVLKKARKLNDRFSQGQQKYL